MKTVLMVILLFMVAVLSGCKEKLEVGQVWETVYGGDDPFAPKSIVLRKIVALDSGYVQYVRIAEWGDGVISSMREGVFRACDAKLISNEPAPYPFSGVPIEEPDGIIIAVSDPNGLSLGTLIVKPAVWGQGELPADHQEFFGDGNASRLNYVQNRVLNKHDAILKILAVRVLALEAVDPNG